MQVTALGSLLDLAPALFSPGEGEEGGEAGYRPPGLLFDMMEPHLVAGALGSPHELVRWGWLVAGTRRLWARLTSWSYVGVTRGREVSRGGGHTCSSELHWCSAAVSGVKMLTHPPPPHPFAPPSRPLPPPLVCRRAAAATVAKVLDHFPQHQKVLDNALLPHMRLRLPPGRQAHAAAAGAAANPSAGEGAPSPAASHAMRTSLPSLPWLCKPVSHLPLAWQPSHLLLKATPASVSHSQPWKPADVPMITHTPATCRPLHGRVPAARQRLPGRWRWWGGEPAAGCCKCAGRWAGQGRARGGAEAGLGVGQAMNGCGVAYNVGQ